MADYEINKINDCMIQYKCMCSLFCFIFVSTNSGTPHSIRPKISSLKARICNISMVTIYTSFLWYYEPPLSVKMRGDVQFTMMGLKIL